MDVSVHFLSPLYGSVVMGQAPYRWNTFWL